MSGFTAEWLRLRGPADAAARAEKLVEPFAGKVRRIADLASGTGANIRYLAPRLGGRQEWLAVDRDPSLLAALLAPANARVSALRLDLAHALDDLPFGGYDLVTASALLDLVSAAWMNRLAARCAEAGASVLFALTYDGRIDWLPREKGDARVRSLVNRHQRGDKGFGPALGPHAARAAAKCFRALGYEMRTARSDWALGPDAHALQTVLIDDWSAAAAEIAPEEAGLLREWAQRRRAHVNAGRSRLRVGHIDMAGWARRSRMTSKTSVP